MNNKHLEYYFDSKIYSSDEVQKSIDETKKEFPNKSIKVNVTLNDYGVYVITFEFENKNTFFNKIKIFLFKRKQAKQQKVQKRLDKYEENKAYGQYKSTGTYRPY